MTGWLEILVVAFVAQLAVLPGEKVQFIIAGLSTRYDPLLVVSAAGSAFAGWTALEILFGRALQAALSPAVLDAITGGLFLLFGYLLYRSAPDREPDPDPTAGEPTTTDGGILRAVRDDGSTAEDDLDVSVLGYDVPDTLGGFLPIFALMAVGEFGDKTQLVTIGLAVQYGANPAIWVGEMLAIVPVSLANAYFFHRFAHRIDVRQAHLGAAVLFAFFGADVALELATGFSVWETLVERLAALAASPVG